MYSTHKELSNVAQSNYVRKTKKYVLANNSDIQLKQYKQ